MPVLTRRARAPRRPSPSVLRRERRYLLRAREQLVYELGGLAVELYRHGDFREDLLAERCAAVIGVDARLSEIDDWLHGRTPATECACGAPLASDAQFCTVCGRASAAGSG